MIIEFTNIPDVQILKPERIFDNRGYISSVSIGNLESFEKEELDLGCDFVQENDSFSYYANTIRGLHTQRGEFAQGKLIRVASGSIVDIAVDIRPESPTFKQHVKVELSSDNGWQLWIPPGFLHGFCTLISNTLVLYKMTKKYKPNQECGIVWNDPDINIKWPSFSRIPIISMKDQCLPKFRDVSEDYFD